MEPALRSRSGLCPQVLGLCWDTLDEAVRKFHAEGAVVRSVGSFRVSHGNNRLVRFLARLARLPAPGEAVDMQLTVTPQNQGEEWRRVFAGRPLVSTQWKRADGLLAERVGLLEMRFRLEVAKGALHYQTGSVAVRLGPLRVPLPRFLSPRVTAWEKADGAPGRTNVAVEVRLPLFGLLIAYQGTVTRTEARAW